MGGEDFECWKCGAPLVDVPIPPGRAEECPRCHADLHVCRLCTFYDPRVANACREPIAERVQDKQRANFCGYFTIRAGAHRHDPVPGTGERAALDALFGVGGGTPGAQTGDGTRTELERLFGLGDKNGD